MTFELWQAVIAGKAVTHITMVGVEPIDHCSRPYRGKETECGIGEIALSKSLFLIAALQEAVLMGRRLRPWRGSCRGVKEEHGYNDLLRFWGKPHDLESVVSELCMHIHAMPLVNGGLRRRKGPFVPSSPPFLHNHLRALSSSEASQGFSMRGPIGSPPQPPLLQ